MYAHHRFSVGAMLWFCCCDRCSMFAHESQQLFPSLVRKERYNKEEIGIDQLFLNRETNLRIVAKISFLLLN